MGIRRLALHHSLEYTPDGGVDGSGAVATKKYLSEANQPAQYIDTSCVTAGNEYEISFSYKALDGDTTNVPSAKIRKSEWDSSSKVLSNAGRVDLTRTDIVSVGEWTTLKYLWTADEAAANVDSLRLYIAGGSQRIMLDNVSFIKIGSGRRERRRLK